eukprot:Gb_35507 [translate_table: standard]
MSRLLILKKRVSAEAAASMRNGVETSVASSPCNPNPSNQASAGGLSISTASSNCRHVNSEVGSSDGDRHKLERVAFRCVLRALFDAQSEAASISWEQQYTLLTHLCLQLHITSDEYSEDLKQLQLLHSNIWTPTRRVQIFLL